MDLITEIGRRLDRYFLTQDAVMRALTGDEISRELEDDHVWLMRNREKRALSKVCKIQKEIEDSLPAEKKGLVSSLSNAETEFQIANAEEPFITGLVLGLRLGGISAEDAERMARVWKTRT
jgi:hypothetical protein